MCINTEHAERQVQQCFLSESSSNSAIWALTLLVTFLALVYTAGRVWRDLRVFLLLLANEELPLVATGDKASPESCRTVCEVTMVGGGEEEEWKEGGGE